MRKARRVLIIDADHEERERVVRFLSRRGYSVVATDDGEATWEMIEKEEPDILIIDVALEGIDALELLRRVRAEKLPMKVLSAAWDPDDPRAKESLELGAVDFFLKPFNLSYLEASVRLARVDLEFRDR